MLKNKMIAITLAALMINFSFVVVRADIAPDPVVKQPSILTILLIVALVVVTALLIKKFFNKN